MKARLMYADGDVDVNAAPPRNEEALIFDLELQHLFAAMARSDKFLLNVAHSVVLHSLEEPKQITYRQDILRDCLAEPTVVREVYALVEETLQRQRKEFWLGATASRPEAVVYRSVQLLKMFMQQLARLRAIAVEHRDRFHSTGMTTLFTTLVTELDDAYVVEFEEHLSQLRFRLGTRMSARLGRGNEGTDYVLHKVTRRSWRERVFGHPANSYVKQIAERDITGLDALGEIRDRGLRAVAGALGQSTQHIVDFFTVLHTEIAFYIGCLNLHETLGAKAHPTCFPEPVAAGRPTMSAAGLYDPCLSLLTDEAIVGNDVYAEDISVIFITGANRGGKSTLLRGIGIAQLMMQSGMFVPAVSFRGDVRHLLFTHFKREEDPMMTRGKLDEELDRMSDIVDQITPGSFLLCNESFALTNEREGSQIATEIVATMRETGIKVVYVTHMYELAHGFHDERRNDTLFLRAQRGDNRARTFLVTEGEPLPTSYGADIYERVFGAPPSVGHRPSS